MNFKVGDKVLYIGKNSSTLYIKTGICYTVSGFNLFDTLELAEVTYPHSYDHKNFIYATPLMVALG
jgi:hypothetical protein